MDMMLAGLCNLCDDFGHNNFNELCPFIEEVHVSSMSPELNVSSLIKDVRIYQKFLKTKFSKLAQKHSPCLKLCMPAEKTIKQCVQIFHPSVLHAALH